MEPPRKQAKLSDQSPKSTTKPKTESLYPSAYPPPTKVDKHERGKASDPRANISSFQRFSKSIVIIQAGSKCIEMAAHRDLLVERSPFFQASLTRDFVESTYGTVKFPEDSHRVVHAYLHYLYHDNILFAETAAERKDHDWTLPLSMWIFAEKISDIRFADTVMDAIIHKTHDIDSEGNRWFPIRDATKLVFQNTVARKCPLRRLMVDQHVYHGDPEWYDEEDTEEVDSRFLLDLTTELLRQRHDPTPSKLNNMKNLCHYHLHKEGMCLRSVGF